VDATGHRVHPMSEGEHLHAWEELRRGGSHWAWVAVEPRNDEHAWGDVPRRRVGPPILTEMSGVVALAHLSLCSPSSDGPTNSTPAHQRTS
jgi:hypothetical protein